MVITTIVCDKCKKSIGKSNVFENPSLNDVPTHITIGGSYKLDLCSNCYNSFRKLTENWMKDLQTYKIPTTKDIVDDVMRM